MEGLEFINSLGSTGTQFIDTGVQINSNLAIQIKLRQCLSNTIFVGGRDATVAGTGFCLGTINGYLTSDYNGNRQNIAPVDANSIIEVYKNKNVTTAVINDVEYTATNPTSTFSFDGIIALFSVYNLPNSAIYSPGAICNIYYCKIWDNDVLIRDFLPCIYNGVAGMWDQVENKFYGNVGTGKFIPNKNTLFITGKEVINLKVPKSSGALPTGYTEVQSLIFDYTPGSTFIYTGITPNSTLKINVDFAVYDTKFALFGGSSVGSYGGIRLFQTNNTLYAAFGSLRAEKQVVLPINKHLITEMSNGRLVINGVSYPCSTGSEFYPLAVGMDQSSGYGINGEIFSLKLEQNNVLVRDFIPALDPNGVPCLFDLVENTPYYNNGTGQLKYTSPINDVKSVLIKPKSQPDDLEFIEYLQSTGTQYIKTGVNPHKDIEIKMKVKKPETNAGFGARSASFDYTGAKMYSAFWDYNGFRFDWLGSTGNYRTQEEILDVELLKNTIKVNGVTAFTRTVEKEPLDYNLVIFGTASSANNISVSRYTVYYVQIYDNGTLIRDFRPALYQGVPCMYDVVEQKPYYNNGSGQFVTGDSIQRITLIYDTISPQMLLSLDAEDISSVSTVSTVSSVSKKAKLSTMKTNVDIVTEDLLDNFDEMKI